MRDAFLFAAANLFGRSPFEFGRRQKEKAFFQSSRLHCQPQNGIAVARDMKSNRSIPAPTVIPVLIYPDVRAAVAWLNAAFGFVERVRVGENHRAQLKFGDGAIIVGDVRHERRPPRSGEVTHSVMVRVDDVRAHCDRARGHGARVIHEPTDYPYGERQYTVEDFAGHQWTFSETLADVAPEDWGGTSVASS